jgi:uncharacterized protein (TIGR02246 family)
LINTFLEECPMWCNGLSRGGLMVLASVLVALPAAAEDSAERKQDEQAIRATAQAYLAALTKGDPKALAEFWTKEGYFIDELGNATPANELAAAVERKPGQGAPPETKVTASKIRFLTGDVAIEDGTSEVASPGAKGASPVRGHFHAAWVKQEGRWRLASLCEVPIASPDDSRLADLGWMVGTWTAENGGAKLEAIVQWNATGTFLLRDMKAILDGKVVLRGSQRVGWDPPTQKLRSWSFDSDGGFSESTWTQEGGSWVGQGTGVLPDGRRNSATTVITFDGKDSFTRKVLAGRVDGEPTPDQEIRFTRRAEPK